MGYLTDAIDKLNAETAVEPDAAPGPFTFEGTSHEFGETTGALWWKHATPLPRPVERFKDMLDVRDSRWMKLFKDVETPHDVNRIVNAYKYRPDMGDDWVHPGKFLINQKAGDCEEFALAKFFALRGLGWNARFVVCRDLGLPRRQQGHAVAVVFIPDAILVLDNTVKNVIDSRSKVFKNYRALYSMNEYCWWDHTNVG